MRPHLRLAGAASGVARALASAAPDAIQQRIRRLRWFSTQSAIWHLPDHRMVFIVVPRVATRSALAALTAFVSGEPKAESKSWADFRIATEIYQRGATAPEIRHLARTCFTFAFVRNPLDRLVSAYSNQRIRKVISEQHRISTDASFPEFVEAVASLPDAGCDGHVRSQHTFVADADGLLVDHLGRFERLHEDWEPVMHRFGLPALPHRNASSHAPYSDLYTPALARSAAARYRRDIELFGYEEEIARLTS